MATDRNKPLMRNLGEFFGHITRALRSPVEKKTERRVVSKHVEEEDRGDVVLRRTTIEEVEIRNAADSGPDT